MVCFKVQEQLLNLFGSYVYCRRLYISSTACSTEIRLKALRMPAQIGWSTREHVQERGVLS